MILVIGTKLIKVENENNNSKIVDTTRRVKTQYKVVECGNVGIQVERALNLLSDEGFCT
jgi:hypothetical protein